MNYKLIAIAFILFSVKLAYTQEDSIKDKQKSNFIDISAGLATGSLRDMGTSPLFYTAFLPAIDITYSGYFNKNLIQTSVSSYNGLLIRATDDDFFTASANTFSGEIYYYRHYSDYDDTGFKHYPGTSLSNYTALRINNAFQNAAFSLDNISSLNLNYMITKDFTKKEKQKKFLWLIKYTRKEKHFLASFKIGVPVYSLVYRQGFTNPGNSTLNSDMLLPNYKFKSKVFSGLNTNLSLARVLINGNMFRFTYYWDFFTTGKYSSNRLDMSKHAVLFSLIFKIN